jgi:hypothetical protein
MSMRIEFTPIELVNPDSYRDIRIPSVALENKKI